MFEGFANVWTPVVPARSLRRKPVATRVAGESLALFRDAEGRAKALIDRCPHRGVALSKGRVTEDGCLECPFHAWRFNGDGECVKIPLNEIPAERRARYDATALPTREAGGLIWAFTGLDARGTEPAPPDALIEPGWSRWVHMETWNTHWTRAMENMLDSPHVPFLHRRTIGRGLRSRLRDDSVMKLWTEDTATGWTLSWEMEGRRFERALEFRRPNAMALYITEGKSAMRQHLFCIPEDSTHVRMLLVSTRRFLRYNPLGWLADQFNRLVLLEDRGVVESSRPMEVPHAADEASVATDGPTLAFRKYYLRELREGGGTIVPAERLATRSP